MSSEMIDGIRKVYSKRDSKKAGKAVYHYKVPYRTADGRQTSDTFYSLAKAKARRNEIRSANDAGVSVVDRKAGRVALSAYIETYLASRTCQETSVKTYRSALRNHVIPALGHKSLNAITREDIRELVDGMGKAPATVQMVYALLSSLFKYAVTVDKIIGESPCSGIKLPEVGRRHVEVLRPNEIHKLAKGMAESHARYAALVYVGGMTGLRIGELMGLTWERVNLDAGTVKVDRQVREARFTTPKTKRSYRSVPLTAQAVEVLRVHRERFATEPQWVEWEPETNNAPELVEVVFTRPNGKPLSYSGLDYPWNKAVETSGVSVKTKWHTLRHSYASELIAGGSSALVVRDRMGHGSVSITMDVYGHLFPDEDDRTRDTIASAYSFLEEGPAGGGVVA